MKRFAILVTVVSMSGVLAGGRAAGARETSTERDVLHAQSARVYHARNAKGGPSKATPLLTYHNGPVQHGSTTFPLFWGSSWKSYSGDKIAGIDTFYRSVGGTSYAATNTEYADAAGNVSASVDAVSPVVDIAKAPSSAPSTSAVLAEVAKMYPNPTRGGYYPVYVDTKRGRAGYCAWHSAGTINGTPVQFALFFNLDGDPGCDPGASADALTPQHSQGLTALGNVSGHELSEMLTDPRLNAWYDRSGAENADKCAWMLSGRAVTLGADTWVIQGNWSNAAYNANQGYTRGCIDGT